MGSVERIGGVPRIRAARKVAAGINLRPQIPRRRFYRDCQVGFIYSKGLMYSARSHVGDHGRQTLRELILEIEVPLRNVVAFGIRVDERRTRPKQRWIEIRSW